MRSPSEAALVLVGPPCLPSLHITLSVAGQLSAIYEKPFVGENGLSSH